MQGPNLRRCSASNRAAHRCRCPRDGKSADEVVTDVVDDDRDHDGVPDAEDCKPDDPPAYVMNCAMA